MVRSSLSACSRLGMAGMPVAGANTPRHKKVHPPETRRGPQPPRENQEQQHASIRAHRLCGEGKAEAEAEAGEARTIVASVVVVVFIVIVIIVHPLHLRHRQTLAASKHEHVTASGEWRRMRHGERHERQRHRSERVTQSRGGQVQPSAQVRDQHWASREKPHACGRKAARPALAEIRARACASGWCGVVGKHLPRPETETELGLGVCDVLVRFFPPVSAPPLWLLVSPPAHFLRLRWRCGLPILPLICCQGSFLRCARVAHTATLRRSS